MAKVKIVSQEKVSKSLEIVSKWEFDLLEFCLSG
jgi:hypothetical protein